MHNTHHTQKLFCLIQVIQNIDWKSYNITKCTLFYNLYSVPYLCDVTKNTLNVFKKSLV